MATSWMQKLRLWWRGAGRRREERERAFLTANDWGATTKSPVANESPAAVGRAAAADREGLQAAYLDRSGRIAYYLDGESGEVVEVHDGVPLAEPRYRRVPTQSDEADRQAFLESLDAPVRARLAGGPSFRAALAQDRALERAWYNFKNDRATAAIEEWLGEGS